MSRVKRALAKVREWGGRCVLSRSWGSGGVSGEHAGAARGGRGVGWVVSSSSRKVMLDADVVGEL